jgi:hypothetical protein
MIDDKTKQKTHDFFSARQGHRFSILIFQSNGAQLIMAQIKYVSLKLMICFKCWPNLIRG